MKTLSIFILSMTLFGATAYSNSEALKLIMINTDVNSVSDRKDFGDIETEVTKDSAPSQGVFFDYFRVPAKVTKGICSPALGCSPTYVTKELKLRGPNNEVEVYVQEGRRDHLTIKFKKRPENMKDIKMEIYRADFEKLLDGNLNLRSFNAFELTKLDLVCSSKCYLKFSQTER